MRHGKKLALIGLGLVAMGFRPAWALEGGASVYPAGAENFLVGALPPPGVYFLNYTEFYSASRFNGANGQKILPGFRLQAFAEAPRIVDVLPFQVLGASPFVAALVPLVAESVSVGAARGSTAGIQEVDLTQGLGWHLSQTMHVIVGLDEYLPMGNYSATDIASTSLNRYAIEPVLAFTYVDPAGPEFDIKAMYDFNLKNSATNYQSGQDFHFDYAAGLNIGNWTLGVGGYYEHQTTNDTINGSPVAGNGFRIQGFAFGPDVQYKLGHALLRAKWQHEFIAQNKPQGDAIWASLVLPF